MNIELEMLSNIVDSGDFKSAKQIGITADFFRTSLGQDVWDWISTEYETNTGEVPDETRLLRQFPDFDFRPTKNSVKALYREAIGIYRDKDTNDLVSELQTMLDDGLDSKTVIIEGIEKLKDIQTSTMVNDGAYLRDSTKQLGTRYRIRKENDGVIGVPYPYDCLNAMTSGMCPGDVVYIYGRPGTMKSWLLSVIAAHTAQQNKRVLLYTKEIDDVTLMERVASVILELDYSNYRAGTLPPSQEESFYDFIDHPSDYVKGELFFVTDKGCKYARTVDQLMAIAERVNPDVIFIDGFYLLNPGRLNAKKQDNEKIKAISRSIKSYAQSMKVPIICTSQANRDGKKNGNIGSTEDAAFSDAVGQDADVMLRCFKGPNPQKHDGNSLLVVPKKVREGGAQGAPKAFVINANPSYDWSLQQYPADTKRFIEDMEGSPEYGRQAGAQSSPFRKPRRDKGPFRA